MEFNAFITKYLPHNTSNSYYVFTNYLFILDRETNLVHVFHAETADWTFQEKRLPKPLFSHGCNLVTLKDGRKGILTVGGFTTEGIPAVISNTY